MAHKYITSLRIPGTNTSTSNPVTGSFACGTGATLLVLSVKYAGSTARGGGNPTFNSLPLTQADTQRYGSASPEASCELWYLLDPPTSGSYTVSVPNSGTLATVLSVTSACAAPGYTTVFDASSGSSSVATNPNATVTVSAAGNFVEAVVADGAQNWSPTGRTGTQIYDSDDGSHGGGAQYYIATGSGSLKLSWTFGTAEDFGVCIASFKQAPQNITKTMSTATISASGVKLTFVPGAVSKLMSTAGITASGVNLIPFPKVLHMSTGGISATGVAITALVYVNVAPVSDSSSGSWTDAGGGSTNLYASIDETTASDTDYVKSPVLPASNTYKFKLDNMTDPGTGAGHYILIRYKKLSSDSPTLTIRLLEGTTTTASWVKSSLTTDWATDVLALTEAQANSITNYNNLYIELEAG